MSERKPHYQKQAM